MQIDKTSHTNFLIFENEFQILSKFAAASLACGSFLAADIALRDAKAQFGRPVTVAVRKVQDQAGASWWRKSFEKVLQKMLSTELTNSGNFTVVGRQSEALAEIQAELNIFESIKKIN